MSLIAYIKVKLRERELRKFRKPSPEAVAIVKARDEELAKYRDVTSSSINNDVESELQKLRRPSPEAVAIVKARDEELAKHRDDPFVKSKEYGNPKGHYWKNQPLSPKRFN